MTTKSKKLFLFIGILTGMLAACLGLETRHDNHLGWALLLTGTTFTAAGCLYLGAMFFRNGGKQSVQDRSIWMPALGALAISLVTPLEYLYLPSVLPRSDFAQDAGLILFAGGLVTYLLSLPSQESRKSTVNRTVFQGTTGFPSFLHLFHTTILAGLLLMMLGLGVGYSSLAGLSLLILLGLGNWIKLGHRRTMQ